MFLRIGLLIACFALSSCSVGGSDTSKFFDEKLACPPPAEAEFGAWSKSGSHQVCKIKHGPFVAWEGGYVHVRGQYEMGKESGVWRWYDRQGNVVKEIDYSAVQAK